MHQCNKERGERMNKRTNIAYEDLTSVYTINLEIKKIQEEIVRLREQNFFKPNIVSDMPRGGEKKDMIMEYAERSKTLDDMLKYSICKLQNKKAEVEEFIKNIEDNEIRLIVRLRCIDNMNWKDIGAELSIERTTASKKFRKYLNDQGIIKKKEK